MKKTIMYTYLGSNGIVVTPVFIEGAYSVKKYSLTAEEGKKLTCDGVNFSEQVLVTEEELPLWKEVSGQK